MKVTITFNTTDDQDDKLQPKTGNLYDFFYGANDGQVSIGDLKISKIPDDWEPNDE